MILSNVFKNPMCAQAFRQAYLKKPVCPRVFSKCHLKKPVPSPGLSRGRDGMGRDGIPTLLEEVIDAGIGHRKTTSSISPSDVNHVIDITIGKYRYRSQTFGHRCCHRTSITLSISPLNNIDIAIGKT